MVYHGILYSVYSLQYFSMNGQSNQKHANFYHTPSHVVTYRKGLAGLVLFVLTSFLFGSFGGIVGTLYILQSSQAQNIFHKIVPGNQFQHIVLNEDSAVIDVVKKASPAVVSVIISKDLNRIPGYGFDFGNGDSLLPFFGNGNTNQAPNIQQIGAGSGFFVSKDGLVFTNRHVVADEGASYTIVTNDGKTYDASVLARDPVNDIAILKASVSNPPILSLANSDDMQIGQRVVAIGNSLGQYQNTVTTGIVSGIGRSITAGGSGGSEQLEGVIQTDAAINPGNSGGPLLNLAGEVIGINTAIDREGQLVGFAIPSSDVRLALESFQKYKKIVRPFLGVRYMLLTKAIADREQLPRSFGALLIRGQNVSDFAVLPGSPADKAGLVENDIILEVNGTKVDEAHSLSKLLKGYKPGDNISVKVYHRGEEKQVTITLGETK